MHVHEDEVLFWGVVYELVLNEETSEVKLFNFMGLNKFEMISETA